MKLGTDTNFDNYGTRAAPDPFPDDLALPDAPLAPMDPLDTEDAHAKQRRLLEWYSQERERQSVNRFQMALDEDYYDSLQWAEDEAQEVRDRGQAPLVYNLGKPVIDWLIGTEKRARVDAKVLPREEADVEGAEVKTKLLKYLQDVNKSEFSVSHSFSESIKAGLGWLEDGINSDPTKELIFSRHESWRNIIHDSTGVERDLSDSRYLFRIRWLDLDVALAYFPERAAAIKAAAVSADLYGNDQDEEFWYLGQHFQARDNEGNVVGRRTYVSDVFVNNRRERVKLYECWYRDPVAVKTVSGGEFDGKTFDPAHPEMQASVVSGVASLYNRIEMQVRCAIMTEADLILDMKSPYRHNRFPFTPIWCYRRARDHAPYGVFRSIRDPQDDYNKRMSKAQFILATTRVVMDTGAVEDVEILREEVARPDGVIEKRKGYELNIGRDAELAQEHVMLMDRASNMINQVGGVTQENLGRETNSISGKAVLAKQDQGSVVTAEIFDNLRFARQLSGEIRLSLAEQYMNQPKVLRIVGNKGKVSWIKVNEQDPVTGNVLNDITANQADYVIGEQDYRQTIRQAMFETLAEMVAKMAPEIGIQLLDVVVDMAEIPDKEEIVARIRKINGQVDPNAKMTTEEQQAMKKKAAQQAEEEAIKKAAITGKIKLDNAHTMQAEADAGLKAAQTQVAEVTAQKTATDTLKLMQEIHAMATLIAKGMPAVTTNATG
jgi:hypothetical protein